MGQPKASNLSLTMEYYIFIKVVKITHSFLLIAQNEITHLNTFTAVYY